MSLVLAVLFAAAQPSQQGWTFCIAEVGDEVFVTEVFKTARNREKLEAAFAARLRKSGSAKADVQCPAPLAERTEAVNSQSTAIAFQRNLGRRLHAEPPLDFKR